MSDRETPVLGPLWALLSRTGDASRWVFSRELIPPFEQYVDPSSGYMASPEIATKSSEKICTKRSPERLCDP